MEKSKRWLLLLPILWLAVGVQWSTSVVQISNNGYKNIIVAIHKDVPENPQLVTNLKEMFTKASPHLYKVTKERAFFEEVTIVVPPSWSSKPEYEIVKGGDHFARAEVRVDKPNPMYDDTPYTLQPGQCGERGEYIHLTPAFILGGQVNTGTLVVQEQWPFGDIGRVFVHEWAHLRYGVFDEHGDRKDKKQPEFYFDIYGKIRPTGCAEGVRGWLRGPAGEPCVLDVDGLPNSKCVFYPEVSNKVDQNRKKPSIMYIPSLDSADGFCEDDNNNGREHNFYAPNKQNVICRGRSTWSIISNNPDFKNSNSPRQIPDLTPKFRVIQQKKNQKAPYVLVLDVSGSMQGRRIELQKAAVSRFIKLQLADSSMVGMVSFSTDAKVMSGMTSLNPQTRAELLTKIPGVADGSTAIGKGIQAGIKLLRDSGEPTEDAVMLLVSDGEENVKPNIDDILTEIAQSKIIINTLAFGKQATTKFEKLVTLTGGRAFFYDDDKTSHKMLDAAFVESATTQVDVELAPIQLINRDININANANFNGNFFVDKAASHNMVFLISYNTQLGSQNPIDLTLSSPDGTKYSSGSPEYSSDPNTLSVMVKIPLAAAGKWEYTINNRVAKTADLTLQISSMTSNAKEQPVRIRSWVSDLDLNSPARIKVYAEVKKGYLPVINATVIGTVGRPQGEGFILALWDNGAGADVAEGDGIYSAYFSNFKGTGRYSVEAIVKNDGQAKIKTVGGATQSGAPRIAFLNPKFQNEEPSDSFDPRDLKVKKNNAVDTSANEPGDVQPEDPFERFASGGAFQINNVGTGDVIPPSRVTDLKVIQVNSENRSVHLKWTSPDDDNNIEDVITEVRYSQDIKVLVLNFEQATKAFEDEQLNETFVDLPLDLPLNESNYRVYFAVKSRDKAGNVGDVSNFAMAEFDDPSLLARIEPETTEGQPEVPTLKPENSEPVKNSMWPFLVNLRLSILGK